MTPTFFQVVFRYGLVGIVGTGVHTVVLLILVEALHVEPVTASVGAFVGAVIVSYRLNRMWTFHGLRTAESAFVRYVIVSLTGCALNAAIMYVFVYLLGWFYLWSQACAVIAVPLANFALNYSWTFREHSPER